jgi:hypothetical protein
MVVLFISIYINRRNEGETKGKYSCGLNMNNNLLEYFIGKIDFDMYEIILILKVPRFITSIG